MTSEERRNARYKRRRAKRQARKRALLEKHGFDKVAALDSLYEAATLSARGVSWKASVQRYRMNKLSYVYDTHVNLLNCKDIRKGFNSFYICERGKTRFIQSVHFSERVVQKSLCRNALIPVLTNGLIYDNGASQEGKGTHFALDRLKLHLERHYRHHGREGGILLVDLHDYFRAIRHGCLKETYNGAFNDARILWLTFLFIDAFAEGLGLGSEVSQISAIAYPNKIDHYIKEVLGVKGYARFMDDSYLIHEDVRYLEYCLEVIRYMYRKLGIELNEKKTRICDLKHGFTFLKTRHYITATGKIVRKPCRDSVTRERRRLKRQARLVKDGVMTMGQVKASYVSWKGSMSHRNAYRTTRNMDILFSKLFYGGK